MLTAPGVCTLVYIGFGMGSNIIWRTGLRDGHGVWVMTV